MGYNSVAHIVGLSSFI